MAKIMHGIAIGSLGLTVIWGCLYGWFRLGIWLTLAITFGTIAYHFWMRLAVGGVLNCCMKNRADYTKRWYQSRKVETALYRFLKVKKWKGKMPTYVPTVFSLKEHTYDEIAQAMCQSEVGHEMMMALSFLPLLAAIPFGALGVFLITSVAAAGIDGMFVIMQRYNRPRMIRLAKRTGGEKR